MTEPLRDLKESLSSARKPDITHAMRVGFLVYTSRPCEFGGVKYVRGNYRRAAGGAKHDVPTRADFERLRDYLRAAASHIAHTLTSMEDHLAQDPELLDVEGMRRAAYATDTDAPPDCPHGPSMLPHVAPACSSLMMGIEQAIACGLLPKDPGQPWRDNARVIVPSTMRLGGVVARYPESVRFLDDVDEPTAFASSDDEDDYEIVEKTVARPPSPALVALFKSDPPAQSFVTGPSAAEAEAEARVQCYGSTMHAADIAEYEKIKPLVRAPSAFEREVSVAMAEADLLAEKRFRAIDEDIARRAAQAEEEARAHREREQERTAAAWRKKNCSSECTGGRCCKETA